ncbi:MAG TPA: helix-turn-helix transcriptional regulator, partial [Polyangiaceae bacterium]|nr:helix-turn-helix transcriptional regulator [Polyangiaceae bacterium]
MRGILSALKRVVAAPGAFVCVSGGAHGTTGIGRLVDGQISIGTQGDSLEKRFGVCRSILAAQRDRVVLAEAVWTEADRARVGYWRDHSIPDGFSTALVIFLGDRTSLRGIAGVERRGDDRPFSADDTEALAAVEPLFKHAVDAQFRIHGLDRRAAALRAIGNVRGSVLVVDCVERCLVSTSSDGWRPSSRRLERSLVATAMRVLAPDSHGQQGLPVCFGDIMIHAVTGLADGADPAPARYAAVQIAPTSALGTAMMRLSPRERAVAQLLVEGYSSVNIAALYSLSTNTVRTFMRRLYDKLGVFNRADLVRELVGSTGPRSPREGAVARRSPE